MTSRSAFLAKDDTLRVVCLAAPGSVSAITLTAAFVQSARQESHSATVRGKSKP
jgi:hypothetical protein